MRVRIRFSKTGALVYIGHLDVMRYFQKLMRRAHIPVKYSGGYSPHQLLSFTPPLPLGMESTGEYADVELIESITTTEALCALRKESVPEIGIMSFRRLPEGCDNAMASVRAAKYTVTLPAEDAGAFSARERIGRFLERDRIEILKKTKKSESMIDIRPLIYSLLESGDGSCIEMIISSGSKDNIKPELVLDALCLTDGGNPSIMRNASVCRKDQYTMTDKGPVSLDAIGEDIV